MTKAQMHDFYISYSEKPLQYKTRRLTIQEKKFWDLKNQELNMQEWKCGQTDKGAHIFLMFSFCPRSLFTYFSFAHFPYVWLKHTYNVNKDVKNHHYPSTAAYAAQLSTMSATSSSVAFDSPRRSAHVVEYLMATMSCVLSSGKQLCSGYSHGLNVGRFSLFQSSYSRQALCSFDITFKHNAAANGNNFWTKNNFNTIALISLTRKYTSIPKWSDRTCLI